MRKQMNVRRRNDIVSVAAAFVSGGAMLAILWALWQVERRRGTWVFVLLGVGALVFAGWAWWGARRGHRKLDGFMESVGINPGLVPEEPIPILPPRGERSALVLAIMFLLTVAAAAFANYVGWLDGFSLPGRRR